MKFVITLERDEDGVWKSVSSTLPSHDPVMARLPTISGRQARDAFLKDGWSFARQRESHMVLIKPGHIGSLSVPDHKELA